MNAQREWVPGVGYCIPRPPKPARQPAPAAAAAPIERGAGPEPEPVELLTPEQAAAKVRELMTDVLAALDTLKPHTYGQQTSQDIAWMRRRARTIRDSA